MKVVIAGGGIGGLTAAMALHARGMEVQVYEAVTELHPLGVGINVLPHATAQLHRLDLLDVVLPLGVATAELCFFNRHGQLIWREPRGSAAGYPVPQLSVHRGVFHMALLAEARRRLGDDAVRTGHALRSFVDDGRRVRAEFQDRHTDTVVVDEADVLVGADGIHSTVRSTFHPDEGLPRWSGNVLWRAVTRWEAFLTGRSMFMAGHRPHKFVAYPLTDVGDDGKVTVNWIAELDRTEVGLAQREDWNRRGDLADFLPRFEDWVFDWLDIPAMCRAAEVSFEFPMVDRDPLPQWTHGRVTLLGDAAHPMYPIGSNGASQAIIDALTLADELSATGDIDAALRRYDDDRRPKTAQIVLSNRQHGPERVLDLAEERAPEGFDDVADVFAAGELEGIAAAYRQTAGFDVNSVRGTR
jgi:2-polyprenyl-6-methoxyphenol hydroxylase-like FAD-dependent oxidoreductase